MGIWWINNTFYQFSNSHTNITVFFLFPNHQIFYFSKQYCAANYVPYYKRYNTEKFLQIIQMFTAYHLHSNLRSLIHNTISFQVSNVYSQLFWVGTFGTFWMKKSRWGDQLEKDCLDIDRSIQKYAGTPNYIGCIQT